ncbi:hypothetical protein Tco_0097763 [Tanacetum coccineum]
MMTIHSLPITSAHIPSPDYTPATPHSDEESKPIEAFETRIASLHSTTSPSSSTSPLSPDHPLTQTSPTLAPSRAFFYHSTTHMRYSSSYETPSPSSSSAPSPTLLSRKRCQGTFEPIEDTEAVPVKDTAADEPVSLVYGAARCRALELAEGITHNTYEVEQSSRSVPIQQTADETTTPRLHVCTTWEDPMNGTFYTDIECVMPLVREPVQTPTSPEWSSRFRPVSPASLTVLSPVAIPASVEPVDEGFLAELGAEIELHGGILHDHTSV